MWTAASVRRQIYNFIGNKPFSIRDFLNYGPRAAVDQAFYRMVKQGIIVRIARGLYIKEGASMPSVHEVAALKAVTFNRAIAIHGLEAAIALGIDTPANGLREVIEMQTVLATLKCNAQDTRKPIYAIIGKSSSFRYGDKIIRLIGTNTRQMALGDEPVGLVIRALAYLKKEVCDAYVVSCAVRAFSLLDRAKFRQSMHYMYDWMHRCYDDIAKTCQTSYKYAQ